MGIQSSKLLGRDQVKKDESKSPPLRPLRSRWAMSHATLGTLRKYRSSEGEGPESHSSWVPCVQFCAKHTLGVNEERDALGHEFQDHAQ